MIETLSNIANQINATSNYFECILLILQLVGLTMILILPIVLYFGALFAIKKFVVSLINKDAFPNYKLETERKTSWKKPCVCVYKPSLCQIEHPRRRLLLATVITYNVIKIFSAFLILYPFVKIFTFAIIIPISLGYITITMDYYNDISGNIFETEETRYRRKYQRIIIRYLEKYRKLDDSYYWVTVPIKKYDKGFEEKLKKYIKEHDELSRSHQENNWPIAKKSSYKKAIKSAAETKIDIIYENQALDYELLMNNFSEIDWSYIKFNNKDNKIIIEQPNEPSRTEDKMHRLYNQNVLQKCKKKEDENECNRNHK